MLECILKTSLANHSDLRAALPEVEAKRRHRPMAELSVEAGLTPRITAPSPARRRIRLGLVANARLFRLLIGVGLIASAVWYVYLYAFNKVSVAGVVNAPLITIVSQLNGYVAEDSVGP